KMNVFYIGFENPINVVVENHSCEDIVAKARHGIITPKNGHYVYLCDSCMYREEQIIIGIKDKKAVKWIDTSYYRLKRIPDPVIYIAGKYSGKINKNQLINAGALRAPLMNFDIDLNFLILNYSVQISRNDSVVYREIGISGSKFTKGLVAEIRKTKTNDMIIFYDVVVKGPDNCERIIGVTAFTITTE
ncbi:MAG: hypothetical protein K9J13_15235, partial [Saprospiraceae bacterium]|nr:hypothetical protein [Saprospiraceae bacterium]